MLPTPRFSCHNYAANLNRIVTASSFIHVWVKVPLVYHATMLRGDDEAPEPSVGPLADHPRSDPWEVRATTIDGRVRVRVRVRARVPVVVCVWCGCRVVSCGVVWCRVVSFGVVLRARVSADSV
jgi:hypothetical protein